MSMTREQIKRAIEEITAQIKGPMPNLERALLVAYRKDLREELVALPLEPESDAELERRTR